MSCLAASIAAMCLNPLIIREELQLVVSLDKRELFGLNPLIIREELQQR